MALILFVDDEALTLTLLSQAAAILGHDSVTTENGQEAVRIAEERAPELILLDMNLKGTNGIEVTKALRNNPKTSAIPVLILSAGPGNQTAELVAASGADAYLSKPIRLQTLIEVIREYTDQG